MKVAILSNLFPPNSRGGAEEAAKNQANAYLAEGNEVVVLTLSPMNKFSIQPSDGIKIYELPHRNIFNYFDIGKKPAWLRFAWHIADAFNFLLANDIKKVLEKEKPDLVICHNLKGLSYFTPLKIKKLKTKNYLVMHDVSLYTPSGLIIYGEEDAFEHQGFLTRAYRFFTRKLFSYPEKVFFPSAWLLTFYRKNGFFVKQEKIYQPNMVAIGCRAADDGNERSGFLYVGQLEAHKGIMLLLGAMTKIPNAKLVIVGDGSLMPEIKKRAENNPRIAIYGREIGRASCRERV